MKISPYSYNTLIKRLVYIIWKLRTCLSFQIEHYALKFAFFVQCCTVLSSSTILYFVHGVNLHNVWELTDYLDSSSFMN